MMHLIDLGPIVAWWRVHRSTYLACLAMGFALLFGIILRIDAHNDDLGRQADGGFGWGPVGRPFADWLYRLINSGAPTTGMSPLGVILSVAILALAATLLASVFRCRSPSWAALASAGLLAQPCFLANLSFQFDAPLMATAVLLAMAAAWLSFREPAPGFRWCSVLLQVVLLLVSLGIYQAAFGIFLVVGLAGAALRVGLRDPGFRLRAHLLTLLAATTAALLSYRLAVLPIRRLSSYARDHGAVAAPQDLPAVLLVNWTRSLNTLCSDWCGTAPGFWTAALLLITVLLAVLPFRRRSTRSSAAQATILLLLACAVFPGPQLALERPVVDARTFIPLGAVVACSVLFVGHASRQLGEARAHPGWLSRALALPILALVWSYAVTAYSYAHAYAQQRRMESLLLSQLTASLDAIPEDRWRQLRQIDFIGRLPRAPALANAIRRFPAFEGMVSPLVGNGSFGPLQLRDAGGIDLGYAPSSRERTEKALAGRLPTLLHTRRFHVMKDGPILVVVTHS